MARGSESARRMRRTGSSYRAGSRGALGAGAGPRGLRPAAGGMVPRYSRRQSSSNASSKSPTTTTSMRSGRMHRRWARSRAARSSAAKRSGCRSRKRGSPAQKPSISAPRAACSRDFARASCCAARSARVVSRASSSQLKFVRSAWSSSSAARRPRPSWPTGKCMSHCTQSSVTSMLRSMRCVMQNISTCSRLKPATQPPCSMVAVASASSPGLEGSSAERPPGTDTRTATASASARVRAEVTATPLLRRRRRRSEGSTGSGAARPMPSGLAAPPLAPGGASAARSTTDSATNRGRSLRRRAASSSSATRRSGVITSPAGPSSSAGQRLRRRATTSSSSPASPVVPSAPSDGMHTTHAAARGASSSPYRTMCSRSSRARSLSASRPMASAAACSAASWCAASVKVCPRPSHSMRSASWSADPPAACCARSRESARMAPFIACTSAAERPRRNTWCSSRRAFSTACCQRPGAASAYTMKVDTAQPSEGASLQSNSTPMNGGLGRSTLLRRRARQQAMMRSARKAAMSFTSVRRRTGSLAKSVSEKDWSRSCLNTLGHGCSPAGAAARGGCVHACRTCGLTLLSARRSAARDRGRLRTERKASAMSRSVCAGSTSPTMYRSATSGW
mmetsp:Transcript_9710/g.32933  ORF Transcript_9710/g.32933 Transcript_9710/m.32933 type:complete len:624 (-) Transcript_9710:805-2676(-)